MRSFPLPSSRNWLTSLACLLLLQVSVVAASWHIDATSGNDNNSGQSPSSAWQSLDKAKSPQIKPGDTILFKRGGTWRGQLKPVSGAPGAPVTYGAYGAGPKPLLLGSVSRASAKDWIEESPGIWSTTDARIDVDVGNIIFDHGKSVGVKKWKIADLKMPGDYWYDSKTGQVKLACSENPAKRFASIELALRRHIVDESKSCHLVFENLALKYGAAHGFGGGSTHHITIRDCDIAWIGGGHQFSKPDGTPVRFGNGIEFWSAAHDNLVERCRLWEIYDAALTNQGDNNNTEANIIYRHNVIWNSEYSFEYWNGKKPKPDAAQHSRTHDILFEYNTCVNAGFGWGHNQRPDRNGRHLMFYTNQVPTSDFVVRNNIFAFSTESAVRWTNDWLSSITMDNNCWFQPEGVLVLFVKTKWAPSQWADYRSHTKFDAHSIVADPKFVNAAANDYRLAPNSPARTLSSEGTAVGSHHRLVD